MSSSIEALRTAIRNEALPLSERHTAAEHYVSAIVDAIPEPGDDDAEVIARMTPPRADTSVGDLLPRVWAIENESRGWAASGATPAQARKHVHERRRTDLLKAIYTDKTRHGLERTNAAQRILEGQPPNSFWRKNGYTAQRLVDEAS